MGNRMNLKTMKQVTIKTATRASVALGLRPITTMLSQRGIRGCFQPASDCPAWFCAIRPEVSRILPAAQAQIDVLDFPG
jgi:hypothetical protein